MSLALKARGISPVSGAARGRAESTLVRRRIWTVSRAREATDPLWNSPALFPASL